MYKTNETDLLYTAQYIEDHKAKIKISTLNGYMYKTNETDLLYTSQYIEDHKAKIKISTLDIYD